MSEIKHDLSLVESRCQASIINYGLYNNNNVHLRSLENHLWFPQTLPNPSRILVCTGTFLMDLTCP